MADAYTIKTVIDSALQIQELVGTGTPTDTIGRGNGSRATQLDASSDSALWVLTDGAWVQVGSGGGGGGTVTSVSGTSPITSSGGATPAISLDDTAVTPDPYGDASHVAEFTVDQKGRLTAAASTSIAIAASQVTSGVFAVARLATGTPTGTKFVSDAGTFLTPAGTGANAIPTTPTTSGLLMDLRADVGITITSGHVTAWVDQAPSPATISFSGTSSAQPTKLSAAWNGLDLIRFASASSQWAKYVLASSVTGVTSTVLVAYRRMSSAGTNKWLFETHRSGVSPATDQTSFGAYTQSGQDCDVVRNNAVMSSIVDPGLGIMQIEAFLFDGTSYYQWVNGKAIVYATTNTTANFNYDRGTLAAYNEGASNFADYDYGQVLIYSGASLSDMWENTAYLARRWGIGCQLAPVW